MWLSAFARKYGLRILINFERLWFGFSNGLAFMNNDRICQPVGS